MAAEVANFGAGHSFPTGVSIRNAILLVTATLNGQPLPQAAGPTVPFWGSDNVPGDQPGDLAGFPGKGFAKILEGRINGQGPTVRPVLFIDAERVFSNTLIPSGATDTTTIEFQLPSGVPPGAKRGDPGPAPLPPDLPRPAGGEGVDAERPRRRSRSRSRARRPT